MCTMLGTPSALARFFHMEGAAGRLSDAGRLVQAVRDLPLIEREQLAAVLEPRYQIVRLIGHGGTASVYLGRDTALHRSVAIKMLRSDLAADPAICEMFRREARLGAQITDRGVVHVLDAVERDGVHAFVMTYAGISLRNLIERSGPLDHADTRRIVRTIACVLGRLHKKGIVHRDIKPDNVLIDGGGPNAEIRLSDLGIATRQQADLGMANPIFASGTPRFMSPEQATLAFDVDERSDLYSVGVLGYFLVTGELPFQGASATEVIERQRESVFKPLRTLRNDTPADLASAIERCLAANPNHRWQTAADLNAALDPTTVFERMRRLWRNAG
jgi:serine/threonine protein kinase